jgi:hypothetical protein
MRCCWTSPRALRDTRDRITNLKAVESDLLAQIRDSIGQRAGTITTHVGAPVFEVTYTRRFSPVEAERVIATLPEPVREACYETVLSPAKVKAVLAPSVYELCQAQTANPTIKPKV